MAPDWLAYPRRLTSSARPAHHHMQLLHLTINGARTAVLQYVGSQEQV